MTRRHNRLDLEPDTVERDLVKLVLTVVELLRQLMERQALRRFDTGDLTEDQESGGRRRKAHEGKGPTPKSADPKGPKAQKAHGKAAAQRRGAARTKNSTTRKKPVPDGLRRSSHRRLVAHGLRTEPLQLHC